MIYVYLLLSVYLLVFSLYGWSHKQCTLHICNVDITLITDVQRHQSLSLSTCTYPSFSLSSSLWEGGILELFKMDH